MTQAGGSQLSAPLGVLERWAGGNPCLTCQAGRGGAMLSVPLSLQGTAYHIRVSAYNMKGWGPPQASVPPFAIPSSEYPREHSHGSQHRPGWGQSSSLCHPGVPLTAGMRASGPRGRGRIWSLRPGGGAVPGGLGCCLQPTGTWPSSDFSALN